MAKKPSKQESIKLVPHAISKEELMERVKGAHDVVYYGDGGKIDTYKALSKEELIECAKNATDDIEDADIVDSEKLNQCVASKARPISKDDIKEIQTRIGDILKNM